MNRVSFDFSGTTTVITGGASGIGLATAEYIVANGWNIIISESSNPNKTTRAIQSISQVAKEGVCIGSFPCRVEDPSSVAEFFQKIADHKTRVDYIIHSAGICPDKDYMDQTAEDWTKVLATNLTGTHLVTQQAVKLMQQQELVNESDEISPHWVRGRITYITSTNGIDSYGSYTAHYDASKAAMNNMVRNLGEELHKKYQIILNGIAPGWIDTDMNLTLPPEERVSETAKIWSGRFATPRELAINIAASLLLPYRSGRVEMIDGGYR